MRYLEIPKGVLLLIARLISQFSMVISTSLVINNAGTSIFAQMTVIWALASFFSFADFGLANGIVNLLTTEDPISQERHIRRTLALLVSLSVLLIAVISSPIGSFAIRQLSFSANKEWSSEFDLALKFGVISAILYNFYVLLVRILQSRSKEISLSVLMICLSISNVLYTYIVSSTNSPLTYLSFANYGVLGIAAICILVARSLHIVFSFRNFIETFREAHLYLGTGKIFLLIQVTYLISYQLDSVILAHFLNLKQVAQFSLYFKIYTLPIIALSSLLNHVWSDSSILFKKYDFNGLNQLIRNAFQISLIVIIMNVAVGILFADELVNFLSGGEIEKSAELNFFFIAMSSVFCISVPISQILYGISARFFLITTSILGAVTNLILSIILLRMTGSVVSTLVATMFCQLFLLIFPFYFFWKKFTKKAVTAQ